MNNIGFDFMISIVIFISIVIAIFKMSKGAAAHEGEGLGLKNTHKLIFSIMLVLIVWLSVGPKTPQEYAIAKYIKATNSNSITSTMIVNESNTVDSTYGRLYYVNGVIGDYADVNFFYLVEDSGGWKVDSCGTGP